VLMTKKKKFYNIHLRTAVTSQSTRPNNSWALPTGPTLQSAKPQWTRSLLRVLGCVEPSSWSWTLALQRLPLHIQHLFDLKHFNVCDHFSFWTDWSVNCQMKKQTLIFSFRHSLQKLSQKASEALQRLELDVLWLQVLQLDVYGIER